VTVDPLAPARGRLHYAWTVAGVTLVTLGDYGGAFLASVPAGVVGD
jgi:hypothetical protein